MLPLLAAVIPMVGSLLEKYIPDPQARQKELDAIIAAATAADQAQAAIDQQEAQSSSLFIAGWRPFIGWVCGSAFAFYFIAAPLIVFLGGMFGKLIPLPHFDMETLMPVLLGMLGLGGFRTLEKIKGVA
jgi:hypothetical protein